MGEKFNDLEMEKKRDHKIIITDEAIAKVPYIRYQEIPEKRVLYSSRICKRNFNNFKRAK
ncbi:MAG: hypothetical protein K1W19_19065 [Lachnospiraceae bacterium]|nr:hypothetical protein [Lachnospiraceae bacterium]MCI8825994.1 hypothetical protein [Lachnospiraceae bacterium]